MPLAVERRWRRPPLLALIASAWALVLLPGSLTVWSSGGPGWLRAIGESAPYDGVRTAAAGLGLDDYVVFGVPIGLSFLLLGIALRSLTAPIGWPARVLSWLALAGSVIVVVSYVASEWPTPWRYIWGSEVFVLALMGLAALVAAVAAAMRRVRPVLAVVLLALLLPIEVLGTVVFEYWPHGSLVFVGPWLAALLWLLGRTSRPKAQRETRVSESTERAPVA